MSAQHGVPVLKLVLVFFDLVKPHFDGDNGEGAGLLLATDSSSLKKSTPQFGAAALDKENGLRSCSLIKARQV